MANTDEQNKPNDEGKIDSVHDIEIRPATDVDDEVKKCKVEKDKPEKAPELIMLPKSRIQEATTLQPKRAWLGSRDPIPFDPTTFDPKTYDPKTFDPTLLKIDPKMMDKETKKALKNAIRDYYWEEDKLEPWQIYCYGVVSCCMCIAECAIHMFCCAQLGLC